jgi:hypothetical protein
MPWGILAVRINQQVCFDGNPAPGSGQSQTLVCPAWAWTSHVKENDREAGTATGVKDLAGSAARKVLTSALTAAFRRA